MMCIFICTAEEFNRGAAASLGPAGVDWSSAHRHKPATLTGAAGRYAPYPAASLAQ